MKSIVSRLVCVSLVVAAPPALGAHFAWEQVELTGAKGVPAGKVHEYKFKGVIKGWGTYKKDSVQFQVSPVPVEISSKTGEKLFATIWTQGKASWDAAKKEAKESFHFDGDIRGQFVSRLQCTSDPWLGPTSCVVMSAQYQGEKGPLYDWSGMVHKAKLPLSSKSVDVNLATQLSAANPDVPAKAAPPPAKVPPPKKQGPTEFPVLTLPAKSAPDKPAVAGLPPLMVQKPAMPDLVSATRVRIAGKHSAAWGSAIALTDADARAASGGVCQVAFEHELRNAGQVQLAATSRRWNNQNHPITFAAETPALAPGQSVRRVDTLPLRPGPNVLVLGLDNNNQVQEANENNTYTVTVTVNGTCGGGLPAQARGGVGESRFGQTQSGTGGSRLGQQR